MTANERPGGRNPIIKAIYMVADLVVLNLLFWLVIETYPELKGTIHQLRMMWLLLNISYLPVAVVSYAADYRTLYMERVVRGSLMAVTLHALFFLSLNAFLHIELAGRVYVLYYALVTFFLTTTRLVESRVLKAARRRGYNFVRVAIVGAGPTAQRLYECMQTDTGFGYRVMGFFDDDKNPPKEIADYVYSIDTLEQFVRDKRIDKIFFTLSGHNDALAKAIKISDDNMAEFFYVPQIPATMARRFQLENIGPLPVLETNTSPLKSAINRTVKRGFDIVFSGLILLLYPLVYIPVALGIKMSSPGPVYFKQERTGYRGKTFMCLKFRTMKVNESANTNQATKDDPRKTAIGNFLRRTSIDELPQFINVFRGEMSVVGPRPHMLKHTEDYTRLVDRYMMRHAVKPGITGWAQVNGYRGITDELWKMERRVQHDMWYIENWTFLLDLKIIFRTVLNAFQGEKNAY